MKAILIALVAAAALSGCASRYATLSDADLAVPPSHLLCEEYNRHPHPRIKAELTRRCDMTGEQWDDIDAHLIHVGMTETHLICAFGYPGPLWGDVNTYADARGVTKQYIYSQDDNGIGGTYVYLRNGVITNIDQIK